MLQEGEPRVGRGPEGDKEGGASYQGASFPRASLTVRGAA
jgi:hypothetical protein